MVSGVGNIRAGVGLDADGDAMTPLPPALVEQLITVAIAARGDLQEICDSCDWFEADYGDDLERLRMILDEIAEASKPGSGETT